MDRLNQQPKSVQQRADNRSQSTTSYQNHPISNQYIRPVKPNQQVKPSSNVKPVKPGQFKQQQQQCQTNTQDRVYQNRAVEDNTEYSLAGRRKMTRLEQQAAGIPRRVDLNDNQVGNRNLYQQQDYYLVNNNVSSFKTKKVKSGTGFLILPIIVLILLILLVIFGINFIKDSIDSIGINSTSLLSSEAITDKEFIQLASDNNLTIEKKDLGSGITEISAYTSDFKYEINFITFSNSEETLAYYNYIIEDAKEVESSISSSIIGRNSAESTFISDTYNGFMDITYIDNTIIIGIAYDSNEQSSVIELINSIGY